MILFKVRWFWILFALVFVGILLPGFLGWYALEQGGDGIREPAGIKFLAERLFFTSLVSAVVIAFISAGLLVASRRNTKKAENLLLNKLWMQDVSDSNMWQERFGDLGTAFYRANQVLLEAERQKGIKIKGMAALVGFLVRNFDSPVFVVNAAGDVVYISNEYLEKADATRSSIYGQPINQVFSDVYFPEVISEFGRNPGMRELTCDGRKYALYNISDNRGETVYVVFSLGKHSFQQIMHKGEQVVKKQKKRRWI